VVSWWLAETFASAVEISEQTLTVLCCKLLSLVSGNRPMSAAGYIRNLNVASRSSVSGRQQNMVAPCKKCF